MKKILSKADKKSAKDHARILALEKLFVKKRDAMLASRLESMPMSRANRSCILNDVITLRRDLNYDHPVDRRDRVTGRAVLTEAVANNHFNIVKMLVNEYDVDISVPTLLAEQSALHIAVENCNREIASFLLTYGADPNARDKR